MTQAQRRGACPSIDAPMQTGDGLLVRITPARGFFDPDELLAITVAAELCGNGTLEVSTRGNLQVRGLSPDTAPTFKAHILDAGIEVASGVAIVSNPLAGFDPMEICDASKLHGTLRSKLAKSEFAARLGPKVSVVIDGGGAFNLSQLIADVRVKAVAKDGVARWQLFVGGTQIDARALGLAHDDRAAVTAVLALLERIALRGETARGRDLDGGDLSEAMEFLEAPSGHEPGASKTPCAAQPCWPIGLFNLKAGRFAVGFGLPFGITGAATLAEFVNSVANVGAAQIRPAPGKAILVPGLDGPAANRLLASVQALGLICEAGDPRAAIVTCAGKPACNSAHIDTRSLAARLAREFGDRLVGDPLRGDGLANNQTVHISGCDKLCANPGSPRLEIIGTSDGYKVAGGGGTETCSNADDLSRMIGRALSRIETSTTQTTSTTTTKMASTTATATEGPSRT